MPLDIAFGIFGAMITARLTGLPLNWQLVFVGVLFSLLPDVDFAVYFFSKPKIDAFSHEHRDILHKPIPYIVVGFCILVFWSPAIAWLFVAMSLWHFLHDSIPEGGGWGIAWLYSFSKKYYKFFSGADGKFSARHLVASWTYQEQRKAAAQFGDPNWARHYLHKEFIFEILVFAIALAALIVFFRWAI